MTDEKRTLLKLLSLCLAYPDAEALEALPELTSDDRRAIHSWQAAAYQSKQDWPNLAKSYATAAESGLVEHLEARHAGVEVTWVAPRELPGAGPLSIEVELNGGLSFVLVDGRSTGPRDPPTDFPAVPRHGFPVVIYGGIGMAVDDPRGLPEVDPARRAFAAVVSRVPDRGAEGRGDHQGAHRRGGAR